MHYLALSLFSVLYMTMIVTSNRLFFYKSNVVFSIFICLSIVSYFIGFRNIDVLGDTWKYVYTYNLISSLYESRLDGEMIFGNGELAFWPMASLFKSMGFSARLWLVTLPVISVVLISISYSRLIDKREHFPIVFVGLFFSYYLVFMCAMRQSFAESFVLLSYVFSLNRSYKASLVFALIAVSFHSSAYIALSFVFLRLIKWKSIGTIKLFFILGLSTISNGAIIDFISFFANENLISKLTMYEGYNSSFEFEELIYLKQFWILSIISLVYVFTFRGSGTMTPYLCVFLFTMLTFFSYPVIAGRMMGYLSLAFPIVVYNLVDKVLSGFKETNRLFLFVSMFILFGWMTITSQSTIVTLGL